jgi:hypothetical protein
MHAKIVCGNKTRLTWICHLRVENVAESACAKTAGVATPEGDGRDLRVVDGPAAVRQADCAGVAGDSVVVQIVHKHGCLPWVTDAVA